MEVLNKLATEGGGDFDYPLIIGDSIIRYEDDECIIFSTMMVDGQVLS